MPRHQSSGVRRGVEGVPVALRPHQAEPSRRLGRPTPRSPVLRTGLLWVGPHQAGLGPPHPCPGRSSSQCSGDLIPVPGPCARPWATPPCGCHVIPAPTPLHSCVSFLEPCPGPSLSSRGDLLCPTGAVPSSSAVPTLLAPPLSQARPGATCGRDQNILGPGPGTQRGQHCDVQGEGRTPGRDRSL